MKKVLFRVVSIGLIVCMVFSFAGCGAYYPEQVSNNQEISEHDYNVILDGAQIVHLGEEYKTSNGSTVEFVKAFHKDSAMATHGRLYFLTWITFITGGTAILETQKIKADEGYKVIDLDFKYKNGSGQSLYLGGVIHDAEIKVGDKFYDATVLVDAPFGLSLEDKSLSAIKVKKHGSKRIHIISVVPEEVFENNTDVTFAIYLDENAYRYDYQ